MKIEKCPFCGGEALMRERYIAGVSNTKHYRRECRHCKATFANWYRSMKKADEAWNRRAQPENEPLTKEQNKQLLHEVCKLAVESVKRDAALAKLEAEVEGALLEKAERSRANSFSVQTDMFGEYCLVPTGCDKEKHIYKVVTRFRSNSYCGVPLVYDSKPVLHDGVVDVLNVIHCGIDETKVERVALSDVELCGKRLEEHHEAD